MNNLLKQEIYKLALKKSTKWLFGILFLLVIILGNVFSRFGGTNEYFGSYGFVGMLISIIILVNASASLMTEWNTGSIKILLSRQYSRITVFFSKLITLVLMHLALLFTAFVGMMLSRVIFFAGKSVKISWFEPVIANLLTTWMVVAITILLVVLLRSSAVALTIGMILTVGGSLISGLMTTLIAHFTFVKWLPTNMLMAGQEYRQPLLHSMTSLSVPEIVGGNLIYLVIFMGLAIWSFNKQNV
ncbi:ABC transporter permease subunit [Periweissella cryptocerci]|nr:ABC transporter permease subunit [Periweissella cryptocerci]